MKMTDEQMQELAPGEYTDWEKRVWRRGYDDARLAADQQKGGGEAAAGLVSGYLPTSRCVEIKLDGPIPDWVKELPKRAYLTSTAELEAVGRSGEGHNADWCAGWNAHNLIMSAPQPSIPAPAQQDGKSSGGMYLFTSDEVREAIELLHTHRSSIVTEAIHDMESCLLANVDDALAHPPHADQETQS